MPDPVTDGRGHMVRCSKVRVMGGLLLFDEGMARPAPALEPA